MASPEVGLLDQVATTLWAESRAHDRADADLTAMLAPLTKSGLFKAVLPPPFGIGLATNPDQIPALIRVLRLIGGANLSVGRLFEGHVNAAKLVFAFGGSAQREAFADAVTRGAVSGVWNAESPPVLELGSEFDRNVLRGRKIYCSGAGFLSLPLVTARIATGETVMIVSPSIATAATYDLSGWRMRGMRATATGTVDFTGIAVTQTEIIGRPGDFYRHPGFRGGAWRFCAVQTGAIERIAYQMRQSLRERGRQADPHQRARTTAAAVAAETARLWVSAAARCVESEGIDVWEAVSFAGMARIAVEQSAVSVIQLAEKSLGLAAFAEAEPIERVVRDLSTYLRQPFPDAAADDVAKRYLDADPGVHPGLEAG